MNAHVDQRQPQRRRMTGWVGCLGSGCLVPILGLLILACFVAYGCRLRIIDRGLQLDDFQANGYTYHIRSDGLNTISDRRHGVRTSETGPPYTMVLTIEPDDESVTEIELLTAFRIDGQGNRESLMETVREPVAPVERNEVRNSPGPRRQARFEFVRAIRVHQPFLLEVQFRAVSPGSKTIHRQILKVHTYTTERRSLEYWENLMGI